MHGEVRGLRGSVGVGMLNQRVDLKYEVDSQFKEEEPSSAINSPVSGCARILTSGE